MKKQDVHIAVFGLNQNGNGTNGRSDVMKVLWGDTKNKIAKVTSLQQDTFIYIPSNTEMKIEQKYS